ncbi:MAG: hypothetical protein HOC70_14710 [Gammaproteobacteria bacterium]|jgi:hypothetical protein|nr:hypothetical protein [Gammaproteobacteria bacterium]MBT4494491.1 hypothetical protein [Gammaproteobacteria bacterium]MBT7371707.1 hypothetical protein [Gammaproteobacteria bacterium]
MNKWQQLINWRWRKTHFGEFFADPHYFLAVAMVAGVGVIFRLPMLMSPNQLPDGDEAIVGIMALDLMGGELASVFFYGQQYGLAIFEAALTALGFYVIGFENLLPKVASMLYWLIGIALLMDVVRQSIDQRSAIVTGLILVTNSAFAFWSIKAWGGVVPGFVFFSGSLWVAVAAHHGRIRRESGAALTGLLCVFTFFSYPLWFPPLLPVLLWSWSKSWNIRELVIFVGCATLAALVW